jgi:hypothetical protein
MFGCIHFETLADNAEVYRAFVFGFPVEEFAIHSLRGFARPLKAIPLSVRQGQVWAAISNEPG